MRSPQEFLLELPVTQVMAPITARGYIRFVNLRPEVKKPLHWVCDDCGETVRPAKFEQHAKIKHGWSPR